MCTAASADGDGESNVPKQELTSWLWRWFWLGAMVVAIWLGATVVLLWWTGSGRISLLVVTPGSPFTEEALQIGLEQTVEPGYGAAPISVGRRSQEGRRQRRVIIMMIIFICRPWRWRVTSLSQAAVCDGELVADLVPRKGGRGQRID